MIRRKWCDKSLTTWTNDGQVFRHKYASSELKELEWFDVYLWLCTLKQQFTITVLLILLHCLMQDVHKMTASSGNGHQVIQKLPYHGQFCWCLLHGTVHHPYKCKADILHPTIVKSSIIPWIWSKFIMENSKAMWHAEKLVNHPHL